MSAASDPTSIADLQQRVHDMAASAARRKWMLTIGGLILAVIVIAYLSYAAYQINRQLDAPTVVAIAEQQAAPFLNEPATAWAGYLEDQAPALMDQAASAALAAPPQLTEQLLNHVDGIVDEKLPELEAEFEKLVAELVDGAADAAGEEIRSGEFDDAQAIELVDRVSAQFETSLQSQVDQLYARFVDVSAGMIDELDRLATGEGLTEKERLHRDLVTSFLALVQRVQNEAGG